MIQCKAYLEKPRALIEQDNGNRDKIEVLLKDPSKGYIDLDNHFEMKRFIESGRFEASSMQMTITITNNEQTIIGFDFPSAYNIWSDYLEAVEQVMNVGRTSRMYGIDPMRLEMRWTKENQVHLVIRNDFERDMIYVDCMLPGHDLLESMLQALHHLWSKLLEYGIEEKYRDELPWIERLLNRIRLDKAKST
ncbi:hypothetical protein M3231_10565 [Neobacillus mesonae]|nr:hypothetical protein [Neobacillus mesonae]